MDDSKDLEQFRQQWRQEVNARSHRPDQDIQQRPSKKHDVATERNRPTRARPPTHHPAAEVRDDDFEQDDGLAAKTLSARFEGLSVEDIHDDEFRPKHSHEPISALEHYERAVEKEIEGRMGDSVSHYRKAFRLDSRVDQTYKNKHFPVQNKQQKPSTDVPSDTMPQSSSIASGPDVQLTFTELIASFAGLPIAPAEPIIKGDMPPPCPIGRLPSEIVHEIYLQIAIADPAIFTNLGLVCRRFAYDSFTDMSIWKRVALGSEFGLSSQKYDFSCDIQGNPILDETLEAPSNQILTDVPQFQIGLNQNWREVFQHQPRIRFTGVYISTVNYTRAGAHSATSAVWNTPVHIVTYYRYLRFFRDGTLISLLTTHEPVEVVHHLTKENLELIRLHPKEHHTTSAISTGSTVAGSAPAPHLPLNSQAIMKHALRGRWRLCHPSADETGTEIATSTNAEVGDLHIETEGVGPRYMYTMHLCMKSSSRSKSTVKNNKLQWKGFWSFNHLTNDWAVFQLKNDRAFVFSRVRSYGMGY